MYGHLDDEPNVRLLRDDDIESHRGSVSGPPSFVGQAEALQYQMARAETKVQQLHDLHSKHLSRPTLDEVSQEESDIKSLTNEITQVGFWIIFSLFFCMNMNIIFIECELSILTSFWTYLQSDKVGTYLFRRL